MIRNRYALFIVKMLSPTPGKLLIFSLLIVLMMLMPLYPVRVHVSNAIGTQQNVVTYENEALALILIRGYEWTEAGIAIIGGNQVTLWGPPPLAIMEYSADPGFMPFYYFLTIFAYVFSCYITLRANLRWKVRLNPYVRAF